MRVDQNKQKGFTIVELLVVIIVLAILATIITVSYNGVRSRAIASVMSSELTGLKKQLDARIVQHAELPSSIDTYAKQSSYWSYQYTYDNAVEPKYYCVSATSDRSSAVFSVSSLYSLKERLCDGHSNGAPKYTFTNLTWGALPARPVSSAPSALATNEDGSIIYVTYNGGSIYKSANGGTSWDQLTGAGTQSWSSIATSDNGQKVIAAGSGLTGTDRVVKISTDGGATWQTQDAIGPQHWQIVAVSGDGSRYMAGYEIGHLFATANDGATWSNITAASSTRRWRTITLSYNGEKIYAASACETNSGFGTSSNGGATFSFKSSVPNCANQIATSADGQIALINGGTSGGTAYYTNDGGTTWQDWSAKITGARYGSADMSADGTKMVFDNNGSKSIRISKNGGDTWTTYSTNTGGTTEGDKPRTVIVSSDGSAFFTYTINGIFKGKFD